ncbi:kinase [Bacillus phage vB_BanS_Sophrita]|uniref:Serine/threonine protein kinase n=1 Tax=Bacillus phage vB_BanS_Sophrita TaxID=2894790 RepID=A0AAE9CDV6_9CAUD|nr:kinase [Bacillus phage vB_BanS_Sophrita]UGO50604.1 serine/threonine protein kinase [Bacillus phage vB_BanS_Sophrita]
MIKHENFYIDHPLNARMRSLEFKMMSSNINFDDMEYICDRLNDAFNGRDKLDDWEELGSGVAGTVLGYKGYAIKTFPHGYYRSHDVAVLGSLQHLKHVPRLFGVYYHNKEIKAIIMSRVYGYTVSSYRYKVRCKEIDNFVNARFNDVLKETIKDIMKAGFIPDDLHSGNVMIDKETGLPVIVDFGDFDKKQYAPEVLDRLDFSKHFDTYQSYDDVIRPMQIMIDEKLEAEAKGYVDRYKELMLGQLEFMGGNAGIGEMLHN